MKRLPKLYTFLIIAFLHISCSNRNEIEKAFITSKKEYWRYRDNCGSHGIYFKFNGNGTYDKYNKFIDGGFALYNNDGDLLSGPRNWSVKNDSTFVWNKFEYQIKYCESNKIVLAYENGKCEITLLKDIDRR